MKQNKYIYIFSLNKTIKGKIIKDKSMWKLQSSKENQVPRQVVVMHVVKSRSSKENQVPRQVVVMHVVKPQSSKENQVPRQGGHACGEATELQRKPSA